MVWVGEMKCYLVQEVELLVDDGVGRGDEERHRKIKRLKYLTYIFLSLSLKQTY